MQADTLQNITSISPSNTISASLDELFPEQKHEEKNIKKAKELLGDVAKDLTQEQVKDITTEIQFLTNAWLDSFEQSIFEGLTLKEILHEKGNI